MARRWWKRKAVWIPACVFIAIAGVAAIVVLPNLQAIRFLRTMGESEPTREAVERVGRFGEIGARFQLGRRAVFGRSLHVDASAGHRIVVAHGVTETGIDDPRLWRLALALRSADTSCDVPEIGVLKDMGRPVPGLPPRAGTDEFTEAVQVVDDWLRGEGGERRGVLGISVGGAIALEAAARAPGRVAAVLLIGAPDDSRRLAREWFRLAPAAEGQTGVAAARADAAEFARLMVLRSAYGRLVPAEDWATLSTWLAPPKGYRLPPPPEPPPKTDAGRRFVAAGAAGAGIRDGDLDWVLGGAARALDAMSPAAFDGVLDAIRVPVFLVHGVNDPLVPASEMGKLAERLRRRTTVHTMESRLLEHVGIGSPGLAETWRHVRFLQRYFDAVRGD